MAGEYSEIERVAQGEEAGKKKKEEMAEISEVKIKEGLPRFI